MDGVRIAVVATMMAWSGPAFAQQPPASPPPPDFSKVEIRTTDLGNNVHMLEGQGGNTTVAVAKDGIIMVDGGQFAPLHDKLKAAIASISNQPIKYLINTHFNGDHTGGNELFAKEGAIVVSQINVKKRLATGTTNGLTGARTPPAPQATLPSDVYELFQDQAQRPRGRSQARCKRA
jgi:glyoxylase-like metal-dependent hydrolase (beta-lactamase superfamily II)